MGCGSSTPSDVHFENGEPTFKGDEIVRGFEKDNGLLFRIVNNKKKEWAYYNDTTEYEMHVKVTFNEDCEIEALGNTNLEQQENGEWVATVVIAPLSTEMFIKGRVNGFKSKMDAIPVGEGLEEQPAE